MSVKQYLETLPLRHIIRYDHHVDIQKECIAFVGAPRKHPYDDDKMLLIVDAFTNNTIFYEFRLADIMEVDEESGIATDAGENLLLARIWVKRGALGLRYEPFEVDNPLKYFKDSQMLHQTISEMEGRN